jgi:exosome complex RNA-binding protein Rrp4
MGCIRKSDQGRWRVDFRDQTGARHRATFDTRKEAENALSDFRRQINQGNFITAKEVPPFRQVAEEWFVPSANIARQRKLNGSRTSIVI